MNNSTTSRPSLIQVATGLLLDGWAPIPPHLFREHNRSRLEDLGAGSRMSCLVAIRRAAETTCRVGEMTARLNATQAVERITGPFLHRWEETPLLDEGDVLSVLSKAILLLGGAEPSPFRRRGGWRIGRTSRKACEAHQ